MNTSTKTPVTFGGDYFHKLVQVSDVLYCSEASSYFSLYDATIFWSLVLLVDPAYLYHFRGTLEVQSKWL